MKKITSGEYQKAQAIGKMKPGQIKQLLEKRRSTVEKDLKDNEKQYDSTNIAIRKYEIIILTKRINQFN
jgi:hypothetical protein